MPTANAGPNRPRSQRQIVARRKLVEAEAAMLPFASKTGPDGETADQSSARRTANRAALDQLRGAQVEMRAANAENRAYEAALGAAGLIRS